MLGRAGLLSGWPEPVRMVAIDLIKDIEPTTGYLPLFDVFPGIAALLRRGPCDGTTS